MGWLNGIRPAIASFRWRSCRSFATSKPRFVNWHANAAINMPIPVWKEYEQGQARASYTAATFATLGQFIPHLIFTGVFERYPKLNWVCAETGMGWLPPVMDICDHIWERDHLWTQGIPTRPSDQIRRQVHMSLWYEHDGLNIRDKIGVDNIMWMTDFPHNVSTYPNTWKAVERVFAGVPDHERKQMLYENFLRLYRLN